MIAALHLPEETFTLHLLLERFQRLVDVVVADNDLNDFELSIGYPAGPGLNAEMPKRLAPPRSKGAIARPALDCPPMTGRRRSDIIGNRACLLPKHKQNRPNPIYRGLP